MLSPRNPVTKPLQDPVLLYISHFPFHLTPILDIPYSSCLWYNWTCWLKVLDIGHCRKLHRRSNISYKCIVYLGLDRLQEDLPGRETQLCPHWQKIRCKKCQVATHINFNITYYRNLPYAEEDKVYLEMLSTFFSKKFLYFSHEYDLTNTFQTTCEYNFEL